MKTVSDLAQSAGVEMPEVGIYNSEDMNAFATGMRKNSSLVAVSSGLLFRMEREEIRAVLAHEVSHKNLRNRIHPLLFLLVAD